jgi:hypothetical protein
MHAYRATYRVRGLKLASGAQSAGVTPHFFASGFAVKARSPVPTIHPVPSPETATCPAWRPDPQRPTDRDTDLTQRGI